MPEAEPRTCLIMHKIKITNCKNHIEELTLAEGTHTIGRTLDSTLRLEGYEVSRLHARLLVNNNQCEIIDENSKNGTFINGKRIKFSYLHNGDAIQIGKFNLQFISDTAKPHILHEKRVKIPFGNIGLTIVIIIFSCLFYYYKTSAVNSKMQLAERTAQYLAERNKEALYLGEYDSINITSLPKEVVKIAFWDRHGKLRICKPSETEPDYVEGSALHIHRSKNMLEIYAPIYYESIRVGTMWLLYKL